MSPNRRSLATTLVLCGVSASALPALAARPPAGAQPVLLRLGSPGLPTGVRVGQTLSSRGSVRARVASVVAIQGRAAIGRPGPWRSLAKRRLPAGGGSFLLRWRVPAALSFRPLSLRVAVLVHGRAAASTIPVQTIVGPAKVRCAAPVPPAVDIRVGSGWIVGGAYIVGGPFPGLDRCFSRTYAVTATNAGTGAVAASQTVAGGHSYTLVVPAGSYELAAGGCSTHAPVIVRPGAQSTADVVCDVP